MALINCPECETQVSDKAANCPSCGYPILKPTTYTPSPSYIPSQSISISKSRWVYIVLGIVFGAFGFHNFYSGHNLVGAIKIGLLMIAFLMDASTGFFTGFSQILLAIFAIWAIIEIIVVKNDSKGTALS